MKKVPVVILTILCFISLKGQNYDKTLETFVDSLVHLGLTDDQPGVAIGIIQNGQTVFVKGYGMACLENNLPVTSVTKFNLASCSKQFTAACILLLEKEGKISLDEDIHMYLPELPDFGHKITIRSLCHHTSGIPPNDVLQLFNGTLYETKWDQEDENNLICKYARLNFIPNDEYLYSNSGYFLMARIIEKCTGISFEKYLQKALLDPLGMKNTVVYDRGGEVITNSSTGYAKSDDQYVNCFKLESIIGSTNQYTTIEDMMLWDKALLNGQFFGKDLINKFFLPADTLNNGDTIKYTYGFNIWKYKGANIVEHSGSTSGYACRNNIFPDRNFAVVALSNFENANIWGITMGITDKLLKLKENPSRSHTEIIPDKSLFRCYEGTFALPDGMRMKIDNVNDTLWLLIPGAPRFRLVAESNKDFFLKEFDAQCSFSDVQNLKAQKMAWRQGEKDFAGIRVEEGRELTENEKLEFTGNYRNDVLRITYPVFIKNKILTILLPESFPKYVGIGEELSLIHLSGDLFYTTRVGPVEFQRNDMNVVTGLTFKDAGRVRNIEFLKVTGP